MLTLDVPSLDLLTTVSTVFTHREHRKTSTDMIACESAPSIEYSEFGEEMSEIVDDVGEVDPEDKYSISGCGRALANQVL